MPAGSSYAHTPPNGYPLETDRFQASGFIQCSQAATTGMTVGDSTEGWIEKMERAQGLGNTMSEGSTKCMDEEEEKTSKYL